MWVKETDIIIFLNKNTEPINFSRLAKQLRVSHEDNKIFSKMLFNLLRKNTIFTNQEGQYYIPKIVKKCEGTIRITSKAFGFVDCANDEGEIDRNNSIFIAPNATNGALDKDVVAVEVYQEKTAEKRFYGIVKKIVKQNRKIIVGTAIKFGHHWGLKPFDPKINSKFRFIDTSELKEDYEITAKIIKSDKNYVTLELLKIIGHKNDAKMDIEAAIEDAGIPRDWNSAIEEQLSAIPESISKETNDGRVDLRDQLIVTIDGDDSKDFDDAIEVKKLENGNYFLGVHIADVTHYVKENSPLDEEALIRGTSIYLADRVIPMLPKKLSNGICSLNPRVDRFTLSCTTEINPQGETINFKVFPSIINSKHRLTYNEVNKFFAQQETFDKDLSKMLNSAKELAKIIRKFKISEGYIDFEIEESKLILDEKGKTINIVPRPRGASEMMIEDFMVRANETVAKYASTNRVPFLYRVHDKPEMEKLETLKNVINVLDIDIKIPQNPEPKQFAKAIENLKTYRFDDFVKILMLRTMRKAEYTKDNIGHFGLASKYYSHFTSPIRRYPDLMVHRMLREFFFEKRLDMKHHFMQILDQIASNSNMTEVRAMELERRVADIKKAEYYEQFIGKTKKGQIVSMQNFGFFVEFPDKVDGLVHVSSLVDGQYELTGNGFKMSNGKRVFTIGEMIDVVITGTDKLTGKIDLCVLELYPKWQEKYQIKHKKTGHI